MFNKVNEMKYIRILGDCLSTGKNGFISITDRDIFPLLWLYQGGKQSSSLKIDDSSILKLEQFVPFITRNS